MPQKIPINFDEMKSIELLRLARKCISELNDRELNQWKIIMKN